ncbi:MAG: zeta toxin family protein [Opitutaceae bacterium]
MASPLKSAAPVERPRLLVVAGPNGSGKTSVTEQGLRHEWFQDCLYINPDNLARDRFGDWNSPDSILQAARLADTMRDEALATRTSLAFETVLSTEGKLDYLRRAKAAGYFIRLFFVGTESPAINAARITERFIKGGHEVPIAKIVTRFARSMANSVSAARIADRAYFYDNTPDDQPVRFIFRCREGSVEKIYGALPGWAEPIRKALH